MTEQTVSTPPTRRNATYRVFAVHLTAFVRVTKLITANSAECAMARAMRQLDGLEWSVTDARQVSA